MNEAGFSGRELAATPILPTRACAPPTLSQRLRRETKVAHRLVEDTPFARAFTHGALTATIYAEGLARLYPVYATMETALGDAVRGDRLKAFYLPSVFRSTAILAELRYLGVSPEPMRIGVGARYFERVRRVADEAPALLVAHAYVRYMADVSGGLLAGKAARRALKLPSREGLGVFTFAGILDPAAFRDDFRRRLDAFSRDEHESRAIVAEANVAFELNRALADELWSELVGR